MTEARDVRMGQYGHSNQPSHHILYMYDYAGQPWKTQEKVREVLSRLYLGSEIGQGYPGDEDNGEMSAWYIFSALGFYPLQMGSPDYAIGSPLFTKATVHLENGKKTRRQGAEATARRNVYVQGLKVNGKAYELDLLPHDAARRRRGAGLRHGPEAVDVGHRTDAAAVDHHGRRGAEPAARPDRRRAQGTGSPDAGAGRRHLRHPGHVRRRRRGCSTSSPAAGEQATFYTLTSGAVRR